MPERSALADLGVDLTALLKQEDEKIYHGRSGEFLSSHQLRDFRDCPEFFHRKRAGLVSDPDRPAYLLGRALHCLVIEGRGAFDARYMCGGPINPKTGKQFGADTKAHAEWAREQTREVLTDDFMFKVERMADAMNRHDVASKLFAGGVGEGVVRHEYGGTPCQIRIDYLHPTIGLIDLKTTENIKWFETDAKKYEYMEQLAFYRGVLAAAAGGIPPAMIPCHLVAVEKAEPFRCGVWSVMPARLDDHELQNLAAIDEFLSCEQTGRWPTRYEERRTFYAS